MSHSDENGYEARYGWIEDPEPLPWPDELRFKPGEVVAVSSVEYLTGRTGIVSGYDQRGEDGSYRYYLQITGEPTSWVLSESHLASTGGFDLAGLPPRTRPVLGDGTVVRLLDVEEAREQGIAGQLAITEGLWSTTDDEPEGYSVRLPGEQTNYLVSFAAFSLARGATDKDELVDDGTPGASGEESLPWRVRPVLGEATVVRISGTAENRDRGIAGRLALTTGLYREAEGREPRGYAVRLPGEREVHPVGFGAFEVVQGCPAESPRPATWQE